MEKLAYKFYNKLTNIEDQKRNICNLILIIIDILIKRIYYKLVKTSIYIIKEAKIIIHVIITYYKFLDSIMSNNNMLFISKFWSILCYF